MQSALFLCSNYISVGACGALFGLLTCTLSEIIMNCTTYSNEVSRSCYYMFTVLQVSLFFFAKFQSVHFVFVNTVHVRTVCFSVPANSVLIFNT